ncbi:MAG: type-F conjugative transfer system protein TraW [Pseudomonadota bacterium]
MRLALVICLALGASASATPKTVSQAVDHGQMGETWPVIEPDLLSVIKARLDHAQATGKLDELTQRFAERVKQRVMRPVPVAGITRAEETRSWEFDPSIVVENDIRDHKGNLIAAAGQRVNPLGLSGLSKSLVFVDGDDEDQIEWALDQGSQAKIIFVDGSPFELMKVHQRRFYFDQDGKLTGHFGITRTPARVEQHGEVLLVTEQAIARKGGGT